MKRKTYKIKVVRKRYHAGGYKYVPKIKVFLGWHYFSRMEYNLGIIDPDNWNSFIYAESREEAITLAKQKINQYYKYKTQREQYRKKEKEIIKYSPV